MKLHLPGGIRAALLACMASAAAFCSTVSTGVLVGGVAVATLFGVAEAAPELIDGTYVYTTDDAISDATYKDAAIRVEGGTLSVTHTGSQNGFAQSVDVRAGGTLALEAKEPLGWGAGITDLVKLLGESESNKATLTLTHQTCLPNTLELQGNTLVQSLKQGDNSAGFFFAAVNTDSIIKTSSPSGGASTHNVLSIWLGAGQVNTTINVVGQEDTIDFTGKTCNYGSNSGGIVKQGAGKLTIADVDMAEGVADKYTEAALNLLDVQEGTVAIQRDGWSVKNLKTSSAGVLEVGAGATLNLTGTATLTSAVQMGEEATLAFGDDAKLDISNLVFTTLGEKVDGVTNLTADFATGSNFSVTGLELSDIVTGSQTFNNAVSTGEEYVGMTVSQGTLSVMVNDAVAWPDSGYSSTQAYYFAESEEVYNVSMDEAISVGKLSIRNGATVDLSQTDAAYVLSSEQGILIAQGGKLVMDAGTIASETKLQGSGAVEIEVADESTYNESLSWLSDFAGSVEKKGLGTLVLSQQLNTTSNKFTVGAGTLEFGAQAAINHNPLYVVKDSATLDVKGYKDREWRVELAGGTLRNSGGAIGTGSMGLKSMVLTADSTIDARSDFSFVASGWGVTTLNLNGKTLEKTGSSLFHLMNTTVTAGEGGTIKVTEGTVQFKHRNATDEKLDNLAVVLNGGTFEVIRDNNNIQPVSKISSLSGTSGILSIGAGNTIKITAADGYFAGKITGDGRLEITGGHQSIGGNTHNHTGGTVVDGNGTELTLNYSGERAAIGGDLLISNGATLITIGDSLGWGNNSRTGADRFGTLTLQNSTWNVNGTNNAHNFTMSGTSVVLEKGRVNLSEDFDLFTGVNAISTTAESSGMSVFTTTADKHLALRAGNNTEQAAGSEAVFDIARGNFELSETDTSDLKLDVVISTKNSGGAMPLDKKGNGVLELTKANTYSSDTLIRNGSILLSGAGTLGTGAVTLGDSAAGTQGSLVLNQSANATVANAISGDGSVTKKGTTTVTLTGANTYDGGTSVENGAIQLDGAGTLGTGAVTLGDSAAGTQGSLVLNQSANATVANAISGKGSVTKKGTATVTLTGANTYEGGTTVEAGTLKVEKTGNLGSGAVTLKEGATLEVTKGSGLDSGKADQSNAINMAGSAVSLTEASLLGKITLSNKEDGTTSSNTITGNNAALSATSSIVGTGDLSLSASGNELHVYSDASFRGNLELAAGTINIGHSQVGGANIHNNGAVNITGAAVHMNKKDASAGTLANTGDVNISGGSLTVNDGTSIVNGGVVNVKGGTLTINEGGIVSSTINAVQGETIALTLSAKPTTFNLTGDGLTYTNVTITKDGITGGTNGGSIANAVVKVTGTYSLSNVTLTNSSLIQGTAEALSSTDVTLTGTTVVSLAALDAASSTDFLSGMALTGTLVLDMSDDLIAQYNTYNNSFSVTFTGLDATADTASFQISERMQEAFVLTSTSTESGLVYNFESKAVPEPTTATLSLLALAALAARRRRR